MHHSTFHDTQQVCASLALVVLPWDGTRAQWEASVTSNGALTWMWGHAGSATLFPILLSTLLPPTIPRLPTRGSYLTRY
jgi:hypothetical protein